MDPEQDVVDGFDVKSGAGCTHHATVLIPQNLVAAPSQERLCCDPLAGDTLASGHCDLWGQQAVKHASAWPRARGRRASKCGMP